MTGGAGCVREDARFRILPSGREILLLLCCALLQPAPASAHGYSIGHLVITHPAVVVPWPGMNCRCAHLVIRNEGPEMEYLLGAAVDTAARTELLWIDDFGRDTSHVTRIPLPPGETVDLHKGWCLFMTGLNTSLEADMGVVPGQLLFEKAGAVQIEFMIDGR
jgi:copper(I)-binding protein